jgi:tetratricopeptide (TPR) repeat protein
VKTTLVLLLFALCFGLPALPENQPRWAELYQEGVGAYACGDYRLAERELQAAQREAESAGDDSEKLANIWSDLGATYQAIGSCNEAESLDRLAVQVRERIFGCDSLEAGISLSNLATVLLQQGRVGEAEKLANRAVAILEKTDNGSYAALLKALGNLAAIYFSEGRDLDAKLLYERALAVAGPTSRAPAIITILTRLARLYADEGHYSRATELANHALQIADENFDGAL